MAEKKSTKKESSKEEKSGNERTYLVRYRLPGEKGRNPRKVPMQRRPHLQQYQARRSSVVQRNLTKVFLTLLVGLESS